jgi:hypothetical protein
MSEFQAYLQRALALSLDIFTMVLYLRPSPFASVMRLLKTSKYDITKKIKRVETSRDCERTKTAKDR